MVLRGRCVGILLAIVIDIDFCRSIINYYIVLRIIITSSMFVHLFIFLEDFCLLVRFITDTL